MSLTSMAPGGQWFMPPVADGVPVYVPPKQLEAHRKRLVAEDGWTPIPDPRREEDQVQAPAQVVNPVEVAMQARIDQLETLVKQLLAQQSEASHGSQKHDGNSDSENTADDRRPGRAKPTVR